MHSCLYEGWVRHRRRAPVAHQFRNALYMMYLDLDELPGLFAGRWLWSHEKGNLACFRRRDYLGPPDQPLDQSVRALVQQRTGRRPLGPVRLLTHLRTWGYLLNPVSFYYCFDPQDRLQAVAAQITNTPWGERHTYVLEVGEAKRWQFAKDFHVSPFMPMEQLYDWRFSLPGSRLRVHMENWQEGQCLFDATLVMRRQELGGRSLGRVLWRYPLMTARVSAGIYWQALTLRAKGCPFHPHPKAKEENKDHEHVNMER